MKVLIIHTYYTERGGEDIVFEREVALLSQEHTIEKLVFENESGWRAAGQFLLSVWNIFAMQKVKKTIQQFKPDVVHLHNWHFATGPAIIRAIKKQRVPIVATLHNYRLLCPSAVLLDKGKLFMDSVYASFPWKAIRRRVYRNSYSQTFWLSFIVWFHKKIGTWKMIDRYIVTSAFSKKLYLASALHIPACKLVIKQHFVDSSVPLPEVALKYFLYVGRLSDEKGIEVLLEAFKQSAAHLKIAGEGPLKNLVTDASSDHANIQYVGLLNPGQLQQLMQSATALVFPSTCPEPFGLSIIEAFANGLPVIASNTGAAEDMVEDNVNGLHFRAGDAKDLLNKISCWINLDNTEKQRYSANARMRYQQFYTAEENLQLMHSIYEDVMKMHQ